MLVIQVFFSFFLSLNLMDEIHLFSFNIITLCVFQIWYQFSNISFVSRSSCCNRFHCIVSHINLTLTHQYIHKTICLWKRERHRHAVWSLKWSIRKIVYIVRMSEMNVLLLLVCYVHTVYECTFPSTVSFFFLLFFFGSFDAKLSRPFSVLFGFYT